MNKKISKLWGAIAFACTVLIVVFFLFRENNVDEKFTDHLDKYELAFNEITSLIGKIKSSEVITDKSADGLEVAFKLDQKDTKIQKTTALNELFKTGLLDEVIFTKQREIVFKLKTCNFEDCEEHSESFSGPYIHYLTKSNIKFLKEDWVKVVEEKKIKNWTYYIVWTKKG